MKVARFVQSTQNRKLAIFLQGVLQLLLCPIVMQNIPIFYGGPTMFIFTCFLAQPGLPSLLPLLQVDFFQQKQGILQQIILCTSSKPKKACIRPFDTSNFTRSFTRKYHHAATESLYRLCGEKICRTPTLAGVSYQFGFVIFSICLQ